VGVAFFTFNDFAFQAAGRGGPGERDGVRKGESVEGNWERAWGRRERIDIAKFHCPREMSIAFARQDCFCASTSTSPR
jgi:hypothetical protein